MKASRRIMSLAMTVVMLCCALPAMATETDLEPVPTATPKVTLPAADPTAEATPTPVEPTEEPTEQPTEGRPLPPQRNLPPTETPVSLPENVQAVVLVLAALPTAQELRSMNAEARDEVYEQLNDCYDAYLELTPEEQALVEGAELFEELFDLFNREFTTLEGAPGYTITIPASITLDEKLEGIIIVEASDSLDYRCIKMGIGSLTYSESDKKYTGSLENGSGESISYTVTPDSNAVMCKCNAVDCFRLNYSDTSVTFTVKGNSEGIADLPAGQYSDTITFSVVDYQYASYPEVT